jgi:hypothetical protein
MVLPRDIGKLLRPKPIRQRTWRALLYSGGFEQIGHATAYRPPSIAREDEPFWPSLSEWVAGIHSDELEMTCGVADDEVVHVAALFLA